MTQYIGELIFNTIWMGKQPSLGLKKFWSKKMYPIEDEL